MNLIFRTVFHFLRSSRRAALDIHDVSSLPLQVLPTDLDVLGHMNNGVYLSLMDLGRMDLMIRAGAWKKFRAQGIYPVMANETITFRKSLEAWTRFEIESRIAGYDTKAVYMEQRFVVDGEIYASAMTRARFIKKGVGALTIAQLAVVAGVDVTGRTPPTWALRWATDVALPPTKAPAASEWP